MIKTINGVELNIRPDADLEDADLEDANLRGAILCDADLNGAKISYRGKIIRVSFSTVE